MRAYAHLRLYEMCVYLSNRPHIMKIFIALFMTAFSLKALALNPSRTYKQLPDKYNMEYETVRVKTVDGAELNAWYFKGSSGKSPLVLLAHNGDGNMADYLQRVAALKEMGCAVFIFDYRGYGESSEFEIDPNMYIYPHFQDDMQAAIDYCRSNITSTFSLYGWGIGAGLSLGIGYHSLEVTQIIADSPFLSMEDMEQRFSSWDEPMEVPFAGYEKRFEPIYALDMEPSKSLIKISLIVASVDLLSSVDDMKRLQAKRPKLVDKHIFVVTNPEGLIDNFTADTEGYKEYLKSALGL